jgi:hypothetical protein
MPDLRAGHALQRSRTAWKDAGKVVRDRVVEPGDAVGENSGDRSGGESVSSARTEERLERLLDRGGKRPKRMLHGGVPGVSCSYRDTSKTSVPPRGRTKRTDRRKWP